MWNDSGNNRKPFCSQKFQAPIPALSKTKDAQANLQQQFDFHQCRRELQAPSAGVWKWD
jgi:hypothetical protein